MTKVYLIYALEYGSSEIESPMIFTDYEKADEKYGQLLDEGDRDWKFETVAVEA